MGKPLVNNPRSFDLTPLTLFPTISVCKLMFQPTSLCFQNTPCTLPPMCLCPVSGGCLELCPHPLTPLHNALFKFFGVGQKVCSVFSMLQKNPNKLFGQPNTSLLTHLCFFCCRVNRQLYFFIGFYVVETRKYFSSKS